MENEVEIGYATVEYDENGKAKGASFNPTMKVKLGSLELKGLMSVSANNTDAFLRNAETVFASFFNKMNEIELADRSEYQIKSEQTLCERWPNGNVKICQVKFTFQRLA